jgi:peptidoglycan/xylan/chitin deacetylase (PgdA/CDA1 family)
MDMYKLPEKIWNKYRRMEASLFGKRSCNMNVTIPFISFTFDDFPKTAYTIGGNILNKYGFRGTYYISLGMLNKKLPCGEIADLDILKNVLLDGNELGCHTYSHTDAWEKKIDYFEESIIKNNDTLSVLFPHVNFKTFAYPVGNVTPDAKRTAEKYFVCSRGGCQTTNKGTIDLNNLNAYFLDNRKNPTFSSVKEIIDKNSLEKGWLIFATHGVDDDSSPYGCNKFFFEEVVRYSAKSGSIILPVIKIYEEIIAKNSNV